MERKNRKKIKKTGRKQAKDEPGGEDDIVETLTFYPQYGVFLIAFHHFSNHFS